MNSQAIRISIRNSIGSRLFLHILGGALIGLGGMSCLFYQILESQARAEIQSHLSTQAAAIEGQLAQAEQLILDQEIAVQALHTANVHDAEAYKALLFNLYQRRPKIAMGVGLGQSSFKLATNRQFYYPYFFVDQHFAGQVGVALPAPHNDTRYIDVSQVEDYTQQEYYTLPIQTGKGLWLEPYVWEGITMTTLAAPIHNRQQQLLGIASLDVNVTALSRQLNIPVIDSNGYFAIISKKGNLLAYPPNPQQAASLATYQGIPQLRSIWEKLGNDESGLVPAEGLYWAYHRIANTDWLLLAVVPQSVLLQPVLRIAIGSALGAGIILASVVIVFVRQLNRRLQPMLQECYQLVEADAQRVQRLNLQESEIVNAPQISLDFQGKDELDTLELSFHHMAEQLQVSFEELEERVAERTAELTTTLKQLKHSQVQLVQSEKMSSLGQLVAGVAHEINNPVNFIHGNLAYFGRYSHDLLNLIQLYGKYLPNPPAEIQDQIEAIDLDFIEEDLLKILKSMEIGTDRIRDIVRSLRNFSRLDESDVKDVDIHAGIDSTLIILEHRLKAKPEHPSIRVIRDYGQLPLIECYAGQLNQVFMNLLSNAIDAVQERNQMRSLEDIKTNPSTIVIWTGVTETGWIAVHITDNGAGMSQEAQAHIFDPFFTTKPTGKGTGLGLSISYQVITERHNGRLWCKSSPDQGTTFGIEIPTRQALPTVS